MKTIEGHDVKIFTDNIEQSALEQIEALLSIDVFSDKKIRIMPDVHTGVGHGMAVYFLLGVWRYL